MNPNEDSNIDGWAANSEGWDDDPCNPDWDEVIAFDGEQPPQHSTDVLDTESGVPTTDNLLLEPPLTAALFQYETPASIQRLHEDAPPPPSNDPSPDPLGHRSIYLLDSGVWEPNSEAEKQQEVHSTGTALVLPRQGKVFIEEEDLELNNLNSAVHERNPTAIGAERQPLTKVKSFASRCAPCRFAGVPKSKCDGTVRSVCSRCQHLESKVDENTRSRAKEWLDRMNGAADPLQLFVEPNETLSLPKIMFFELVEAQLLLVALRGEVDRVSHLGPGGSLESLFGGELVCYIDDREFYSPYSTTSSVVAINKLATTATAAAASGANIVAPALDGIQLDGFIGRRRPSCNIRNLVEADRKTLASAWNCAFWIIMLLNWDGNELYLSLLTAGLPRGIGLPAAKDLVLELTYSVAHRAQALIQELCYRTIRSMSKADKHHNPITICCALWIIFTATHKFEKRNFTATSLTNLRNFLSKLHERSRAAFQSINQHK
ncbi:hypothetical protein MFIFM68171_04922 [Madurella fahalii]|uniref:Uncharacterized protein n=1 Tax=Madurella fahalii TaxID=1157608 RepID=A0ABQ0GAD7_9PEZI